MTLSGFPFAFGSSQGGVVLPAGDRFVPPGSNAAGVLGQYVIPRYANGSGHPAGMLVGFGPQSILHGTVDTENRAVPAVVITEDVLGDLSQWYGTTGGKLPAVLQPIVANLTIAGYSTNNFGVGGDVGDLVYVDNLPVGSHPDLYMGARLCGSGGEVSRVVISYIPGTALQIKRPISLRNGQMHPLDRELWRLTDVTVRRVFRGIEYLPNDGWLGRVEIENYRDYGIKIGDAITGNVEIGGEIHTYGGGYAADPNGGPGVWIASGNCRGGPIKAETGTLGMLISGNHNDISGFWSKETTIASARLSGEYNCVRGFWLEAVDVLGFDITAQNNILCDGTIDVVGSGVAAQVGTQTATKIRGVTINAFNQAGAKGVVLATTINNTVIDIDMIGGAIGIDCFPGGVNRLGTGNTLRVTWRNGTATPINLPTGWGTTETNNPGGNDVLINNVRYYAPNP